VNRPRAAFPCSATSLASEHWRRITGYPELGEETATITILILLAGVRTKIVNRTAHFSTPTGP
jgi:hypothetical protein